jgi:hypothetical protein
VRGTERLRIAWEGLAGVLTCPGHFPEAYRGAEGVGVGSR